MQQQGVEVMEPLPLFPFGNEAVRRQPQAFQVEGTMAWWGRLEAGSNLSHDQRGSIKLRPTSVLGGKKWANLSAGQGWHRRPQKGTGTCRRVIVINETEGAGVVGASACCMGWGCLPT